MRSFSTYFREFRKGSIKQNTEFHLALPIEEPVIPESVRGHAEAVKFFAGQNVYSERIDTWNKEYFYEALFYASKECKEEELKKVIEKGIEELGCVSIDVSVRKISRITKKSEKQEFKITIKTL